jgi:hypothetical protein
MDSITLTYGVTSKSFDILGPPRGMQDFDEIRLWPPQQDDLPDGSIRQKFGGAARTITVEFGVIPERDDRVWLVSFILSNDMSLTYNGETVEVVLADSSQFGSVRHSDFVLTRQFTMVFLEKTMSPTPPASWS